MTLQYTRLTLTTEQHWPGLLCLFFFNSPRILKASRILQFITVISPAYLSPLSHVGEFSPEYGIIFFYSIQVFTEKLLPFYSSHLGCQPSLTILWNLCKRAQPLVLQTSFQKDSTGKELGRPSQWPCLSLTSVTVIVQRRPFHR